MQEQSTYRLVGDIEPALCKKLFHVAKDEGKASTHPDRQLIDLGWKSITAIERELFILRFVSSGADPGNVTTLASGRRTSKTLRLEKFPNLLGSLDRLAMAAAVRATSAAGHGLQGWQ